MAIIVVFFFQAEDGIRDLVRSRGLGDVYKRQAMAGRPKVGFMEFDGARSVLISIRRMPLVATPSTCLLYTSDAADERSSVDLGGRRIIKKKNKSYNTGGGVYEKKQTTRRRRVDDDVRNI